MFKLFFHTPQLLVAAFALLFSMHANTAPSQISGLQGTAWEGSYETIGFHNQIRIAFLNELTADGNFQYFHVLGSGVVNLVIGRDDAGCNITPRALHLNSDGSSG